VEVDAGEVVGSRTASRKPVGSHRAQARADVVEASEIDFGRCGMRRMLAERSRALALAAAGLMAVHLAGCRRGVPASFRGAPVVIVSVDTLRADHLPAYGYKAVDTPNLDALRKDAVLFENAYSHVPLTLPSHTTLFTGLLPPRAAFATISATRSPRRPRRSPAP
jgi:hypothetical protein